MENLVMDYISKLLWCCCLLISTELVADVNEDIADREFYDFFSQTLEQSSYQAESNLEVFAEQLKITNKQSNAWNRFKLTVIEQVENRQHRKQQLQELKENKENFSSLELIKLKKNILGNSLHETEQLLSAVQALYKLLDSKQQPIFDRAMKSLWLNRIAHYRNTSTITLQ
ncbi:MAG: Spy/CpxP family protein refolding chaperone [Gammaproteobacteria bacterium]|nr:Spy/CpxP family protein refolding chaperone [Gammaproteobacteria bacterium]